MGIETIFILGVAWCVPALLCLSLARVAGRADERSSRQFAAVSRVVVDLPLGPRRLTGGRRTRGAQHSNQLRV
jgi:hypothetical protein